MSPRKMRLVRSVIRGRAATEAVQQLTFMPGKASGIVLKVLKSAMANARHNFDADEQNLMVEDVIVNEGMVMKRFRPVSKGMAHPILKRSSHVTIVLEERGVVERVVKPKRTQIHDMSAEEHVSLGHDHEEVETSVTQEKDTLKKPDRKSPAPDKQQQAYQKMKAQQQGGDQAKSHRRKSLSSGK